MDARIKKAVTEAAKRREKTPQAKKNWLTIRAFVIDCELATFEEIERIEYETKNKF